MKLNKLERHTAYIIMLAEADTLVYNKKICKAKGFWNDRRTGLCKLFCYLFDSNTFDLLPEVLATKRDCSRHWFCSDDNGWERRKEILRKFIEKTA